MSADAIKSKNLPARGVPTDGYWLEVDGNAKSQYATSAAALKAGLELKGRFPRLQVNVFAAKSGTRTTVDLPENAETKRQK